MSLTVWQGSPAYAASASYGFDGGSQQGFTALGTGVAVSTSTTAARSGYGLRVATTSSTFQAAAGGLGPDLGVGSSGGTVSATGYVKAQSGAGTSAICVRWSTSSGSDQTCGTGVTLSTSAFTAASVTATLPSGVTGAAVLLQYGSATNPVYWDDVSVTDNTSAAAPATPTPTPTATPTPTPSITSPAATPTPSASSSQAPVVGTVTLDATQYGQLFFLLFGFCSLALVLLAVVAGKAMQ